MKEAGVDFGILHDGFYGDAAVTIPVGEVSAAADRLLTVTRESLYVAIEQARPGYDLILLDAYGRDGFPHALTTQEFLRAVQRVLSPQGVVLSNVWSRQYNSHYDGMVASYRSLFGFMAVMATLMLIAHAEKLGVWSVDGGMHGLARALARCAQARGAGFRYGQAVEREGGL